jgi:hypothetical protein
MEPGIPVTPLEPAAAVAALRRRFPGTQIWFGNFTRRYWAIFAGEQLIEATDPDELGRMLESLRVQRRR